MQFDKKEIDYDQIEKIAHEKTCDPTRVIPHQRLASCVRGVSRFTKGGEYTKLVQEAKDFYRYMLKQYVYIY